MWSVTLWIISGLRSRRKNDTIASRRKMLFFLRAVVKMLLFINMAPAPELLVFMSVTPELSFMAPASVRFHTLIF